MLRQIYRTLASRSTVDKAFLDLTEMLDHGAWMFVRANEVIHSEVPADEVRDALYARDRAINELERSIRRKIVRYLTVNAGYDVAACLALWNVAKDGERIGDYCKNLFEVGQFYTEGFRVARYRDPLAQVAEQIRDMFAMVSRGCRDFDQAEGEKALELGREIRSQCDGLLQQLFQDEDSMELHEAIAYSLLGRYYKRVAGHLANIATAVVGQLEDLDFESGD